MWRHFTLSIRYIVLYASIICSSLSTVSCRWNITAKYEDDITIRSVVNARVDASFGSACRHEYEEFLNRQMARTYVRRRSAKKHLHAAAVDGGDDAEWRDRSRHVGVKRDAGLRRTGVIWGHVKNFQEFILELNDTVHFYSHY